MIWLIVFAIIFVLVKVVTPRLPQKYIYKPPGYNPLDDYVPPRQASWGTLGLIVTVAALVIFACGVTVSPLIVKSKKAKPTHVYIAPANIRNGLDYLVN